MLETTGKSIDSAERAMTQELQGFRNKIAEFDGKSPSVLTEAAVAARKSPGYFDWLSELAADRTDAVSGGATWLIKHELEAGWIPSDQWLQHLAGRLPDILAWSAALHLCQSVRMLNLPQAVLPAFHSWATPFLNHNRPFLRAWSLDVLCRLAEKDAVYEGEAASAIRLLLDDKAASVRARAGALDRERKSAGR